MYPAISRVPPIRDPCVERHLRHGGVSVARVDEETSGATTLQPQAHSSGATGRCRSGVQCSAGSEVDC